MQQFKVGDKVKFIIRERDIGPFQDLNIDLVTPAEGTVNSTRIYGSMASAVINVTKGGYGKHGTHAVLRDIRKHDIIAAHFHDIEPIIQLTPQSNKVFRDIINNI